jgi:hypothetical protein
MVQRRHCSSDASLGKDLSESRLREARRERIHHRIQHVEASLKTSRRTEDQAPDRCFLCIQKWSRDSLGAAHLFVDKAVVRPTSDQGKPRVQRQQGNTPESMVTWLQGGNICIRSR